MLDTLIGPLRHRYLVLFDEFYDLPDVEGSTVLVSWTAAKNAANSLVVGASVANASIISGLSQPGIDTLNNLINGPGTDPAVNALTAGLERITSENDVRKAGEQLAPETNFATQQAAITLAFLTGQYIDERLLGVGATSPGFAPPSGLGAGNGFPAPSGLGMAGSSDGRMNIGADEDTAYLDVPSYNPNFANSGLWGQAFGAGLQQDPRSHVDGYGTHIYGALVGIDNWVSPNFRVGFAGGWGHTGIDGEGNTVANETSVSSYMGLAYGAIKGYGWYLSGRTGFAWHNYDTARVLNSGGLRDVASATHDGRQYIGAVEFGTPFHSGVTTITPVAQINYTHLNQDGYLETSQAGMGLSIADQETDSLQSGLGLKAAVKVSPTALLEGRALWFHEFEDTEQQVTAAFASTRHRRSWRGPRHRQPRRRPLGLHRSRHHLPDQLRRATAAGLHRSHRLGEAEDRLLRHEVPRPPGLGRGETPALSFATRTSVALALAEPAANSVASRQAECPMPAF